MIDPKDFMSLSGLAAGGVIAAVVAGWGHVRGFLSYVMSLLIVRATFADTSVQYAVTVYLKSKWTRLPSSVLVYDKLYLQFKDGQSRHVPYRALAPSTLFVSRQGVLLVTRDSISTLRFVCQHPDKLVAQALLHLSDTAKNEDSDRFAVWTKMGSEKTLSLSFDESKRSDPEPANGSSLSTADGSAGFRAIPGVDKSFLYDDSLIEYFKKGSDPLKGLFYDEQVLKHLRDAKIWKSKEAWYADRMIPWRRSSLFYGPGGTGKSSLAIATAKTLNVPLYWFMLSTMSDPEFVREWQNVSTPCVVLFEDFDTVFKGRESLTAHKSLSFDCVINLISGVKNLNGIYLIVTTNKLESIDPAMGVVTENGTISSRPGRIDNVLYLGEASEDSRRRMAAHILRDWPEAIEDIVRKGAGFTPAQFQELCITYSYERMTEDADDLSDCV